MPRPSPVRDHLLRTLLWAEVEPTRFHVPDHIRNCTRSLYALANETGVSFPWTHQIMTELAEMDLVALKPSLRILDAPTLYKWWSSVRARPHRHGFHASDPIETIKTIRRENGVKCAITTYYAENEYQRHLFPRRLDAYVHDDDYPKAKKGLVAAGAQLGGTNLRLWTGDPRVLKSARPIGPMDDRLFYVPIPQVILDLMIEGGSAGEAAQLLMEAAHPHAYTTLS